MKGKIKIVLADDVELTEEGILEYLQEDVEELILVFDLELDDDRATIENSSHDGSGCGVSLTEVGFYEGSWCLSYEFEFYVYSGCKDQCYGDVSQRIAHFKLEGRTLLFDVFVPPERLYPNEEL